MGVWRAKGVMSTKEYQPLTLATPTVDLCGGVAKAAYLAMHGKQINCMSRRAFVVVAKWPYSQLSGAGQISWFFTGGTENHVGLFIPCATEDEVTAHSVQRLSHPSARGFEHVSFDYMADLRPRFQSYRNDAYYTKESKVWLYPILDVDAAAIHEACVEVAREMPVNNFCFRCNAICWCCSCNCGCLNRNDAFAPSTCVALTMRIIARAKTNSLAPYTSDAATFTALGMNSCSFTHPCEPAMLTGYAPRAGLEAMQKAKVVGRPLESFEAAVKQCRVTFSKSALGSVYPLLPFASSMSRT